jgi:hypothetical protein
MGRNSSMQSLTLICFNLRRAPNPDSSVLFPNIWTSPQFRGTKLVDLVCDSIELSSRDTCTRASSPTGITVGLQARVLGLISCSETTVSDYRSTLHNISLTPRRKPEITRSVRVCVCSVYVVAQERNISVDCKLDCTSQFRCHLVCFGSFSRHIKSKAENRVQWSISLIRR